jgi:inner membrane protease ATP23
MESSTTPVAGPSTQPETAFEKWRSSLAQLTGLGLNPVEAKQRDERLAQERLEGDWNQCEKWKTGLMKSSGFHRCLGPYGKQVSSGSSDPHWLWIAGPAVVFMMKHLTLSGCPFTAASIQCHPCPPTRSGGFSPDHGILLCQDRFFSKRHMEDTIVHEMIHAFDHCRFEVDWGNLRHHACSEVSRAG